ncbi:hypothetical protein ABZ667_44140, partial [Streptomyces lavendulae]
GEWAGDAAHGVLRAPGSVPDPLTGQVAVPHPATVRRLPARLDGDALDTATGAFLSARAGRAIGAGALRPVQSAFGVVGKGRLQVSRPGDAADGLSEPLSS